MIVYCYNQGCVNIKNSVLGYGVCGKIAINVDSAGKCIDEKTPKKEVE